MCQPGWAAGPQAGRDCSISAVGHGGTESLVQISLSLVGLHLLGMHVDFSGNFQCFFDVCFLPLTSETALLYSHLQVKDIYVSVLKWGGIERL